MSTEQMIFSGIGVLLALIIGYFVGAYLKGRLKIILPNNAVASGEEFRGQLQLLAKSNIEGNGLSIALVGYEVRKSRNSKGQNQTHRQQIYKDEKQLQGPKSYFKGFSQTLDFSLMAPSGASIGRGASGGDFGELISTALSWTGLGSRRLEWKIEAHLDASGIDLTTAKTVSVRLS
jgi:hypothetical protein